MTRLSSMDAVWMDMEDDGPPLAVAGLLVLEGPAPTLEEYRDFVASRVSGRMREKLTPSTLRIRQATWQEAEPDLDKQVRLLTVPEPGGQAELEAAAAEIIALPMDIDLPLWDSTMITGLQDDTWAVMTRLHHAVADGQGGLLLTGRMIDVDPDGEMTLTDALDEMMQAFKRSRESGASPEESSASRVVVAAKQGGEMALRALRTFSSQSATAEALQSTSDAVAKAMDALSAHLPGKPGPLTGDPGQGRSWATTQVTMSDVREIRSGLGGTVNDVVMTLMAGGYTNVLAGMDQQVKSVRVAIPLSLRTPGDLRANNQVSALLVVLPLGGDAAARLADIKEHIDSVKELGVGVGGGVAAQAIVDRTVPAFVQTFAVANLTGAVGGAFIDSLVTNVPGPPFKIYVFGREVLTLAAALPLTAPLRLSAAIFSYNGILQFGINGGEGMSDAVHGVIDGIQSTLAELLEAARAKSA